MTDINPKSCGTCAKWAGPFEGLITLTRRERVPRGRSYVMVKIEESHECTFGRCAVLTERGKMDETPPDAGFGCDSWEQVPSDGMSPGLRAWANTGGPDA